MGILSIDLNNINFDDSSYDGDDDDDDNDELFLWYD